MNYIPLCLFVILSASNIKTRKMGLNKESGAIKLTLAPMACLYVLINTNFDSKTKTLIILAYSLYLIGDTFLLSSKIILFGTGLFSFLLGHICFIIFFFSHAHSFKFFPISIIAMIYPLYQMFVITRSQGKLKIPMRLYSILMVIFITSSTLMNNPIFTIGASIFTLSDSFIARNSSAKKIIFDDFYIMGTYTLALILLSTGLIVYAIT